MKQHEPVSIHVLLQNIRVNDFSWLCVSQSSRVPPQELDKRRRLVEELIHWMFEQFIMPLLKVNSTFL
jgi:telomerase reverse transcriptase